MPWLVKIWQVISCAKSMHHLETRLLWQLKLTGGFVSTCDVFNCLFPLNVQNEIQLLSRVFCYSWLVCLSGFWLRNAPLVKVENPISDGIVFVFHLAWCARELESLECFWPYFIAVRSCISMFTLFGWFCFVVVVFFFLISWSRTYFNLCGLFVHVCKIWDNDLTYPIRFDQINHSIKELKNSFSNETFAAKYDSVLSRTP